MTVPPPRHLFIGGCPRSGTSALTNLINAHVSAIIGMERYAPIWRTETLTPEHFEEKLFLAEYDFDAGRNIPAKLLNQGAAQRFPTATLVGDKFPFVTDHLDFVFHNFPGAKVLVMVRNPIWVCESIQTRFDNPNDKFNLDARRGLDRWNKSLADALRGLEAGQNISIVSYDKAFESEATAACIYAAVGLTLEGVNMVRLRSIINKAVDLRRKDTTASEAIQSLVDEKANYEIYNLLLQKYDIMRELEIRL